MKKNRVQKYLGTVPLRIVELQFLLYKHLSDLASGVCQEWRTSGSDEPLSSASVTGVLKGQCHEIFVPRFFRQSITPRPQINTLKYFRILFRIRRAICPLSLIPRYAP
jgi:hypothetical protein